jgi:hypothetical protein
VASGRLLPVTRPPPEGPDGDAEEALARFARLRPRLHPPPNEIPGVLPLAQFLGRSDTVAAVLLEVHAYSVGLSFHLTYRGRGSRRSLEHPPFIPTDPRMAERMGTAVATSPEVGVTLADGTAAVTLDRSSAFQQLDQLTDALVLIEGNGGGGNDQLDASYWLTPDPHAGLTVQFAWPQQRLSATALSIDAEQLAAATSAAVPLWPWDPSADVR